MNVSAASPPWLRLAAFALALAACVLVPFALLGDALDGAVPQWLQRHDGGTGLMLAGIALLVADVVLPIPSSIVAAAMCWTLGPVVGGIGVAIGCLLAFVAGYGIGRLVPEARLRRWIGPQLWDSAKRHAARRALWWIALARPLPLLAEVSALLAGVWRVPFLPALGNAAAASCVIGAAYGLSAFFGRGQPALGGMLLALFALPALTWTLHRILLRRWLTTAIAFSPNDRTSDASKETT